MTPTLRTLELTTSSSLPKLPPALPSELILFILEQHLLELSSSFLSASSSSSSDPTSSISTYNNSILPLLLSSSQIYHLLLPLLYSSPLLASPTQSSHLLYTLATTSPSRHLQSLTSLTHSGPLSPSFVSLLNAFGSQVTSLTLFNIPLADEHNSSHGGGSSSSLLSVLSECNPVSARIELVGREVRRTLRSEGIEVEKGSLKRRVNCCAGAIGVGGKKMGRVEGEEEQEVGGNDAGMERVQKQLVGGSVWDVVELGVVGWKRWEEGWIEVREE